LFYLDTSFRDHLAISSKTAATERERIFCHGTLPKDNPYLMGRAIVRQSNTHFISR
jgi:hypothetical protein